MPRGGSAVPTQVALFSLTDHNAENQQAAKNPFSMDLAKRILKKSKGGAKKTLAARKRREKTEKRPKGSQQEIETHCFQFMQLPFDIQEYTLRFLPARALCLCPIICKSWNHVYEGAVASIFAEIVGVARGRSRLVRHAELRLIHSMRHTHEPANAIEMLLWAAFNGHIRYCLEILRKHHNIVGPNTPGSDDWDGATVLHVAARHGNVPLVEQLLRRDANPSALTKQRRTALIVAAEYNQKHVVQVLLRRCKQQANVNAVDSTGKTALFIACEKGYHEVVYTIIDVCAELRISHSDEAESWGSFPDVDLGNTEWGSPLCVACKSGYQKIVGKLLDSGAAVNISTEDGRCPLYIAAERSAINTTRIILRFRPPIAEVELADLIFQEDPQQGRQGAAATATTANEVPGTDPKEAGTIIDLATNTGKTALFVASEKGLDKVVKLLIENGASVSKPTYLNKTPLYAATENGHSNVVKQLLCHCTRDDVVRETNFGTTALFMAQRNGNRVIKNLLTDFCLANVSKEKANEKKKCKGQQTAAMSRLTELKEGKQVKVAEIASIDRKVEMEIKSSKNQIKQLSESINLLDNLAMSTYSALQLNFDENGNLIPRTLVQNHKVEETQSMAIKTPCGDLEGQSADGVKVSLQDQEEASITEESQTLESRNVVCRKERDLIEARIMDAEQNPTCDEGTNKTILRPSSPAVSSTCSGGSASKSSSRDENVPGSWARDVLVGLPLKSLKRSLVEFSEATSDYRLGVELLKRVWFCTDQVASEILKHFNTGSSSQPAVDQDSSSRTHVNAWELFVTSALFSSCPHTKRLQFCFHLFDLSRSGSLSRTSLANLIRCCQNGLGKLLGEDDSPTTPRDTEFWVKAIFDCARSGREREPEEGENEVLEVITLDEFLEWATDGSEVRNIFHDAENARENLLVYSRQ